MEMFSRKETAEILGISLKTLDALREDKRIGYTIRCTPAAKCSLLRRRSISISKSPNGV